MSSPSRSKESSPRPASSNIHFIPSGSGSGVGGHQTSAQSPTSSSNPFTSGSMGDHSRIGLASGWGIVKELDISPAGNRFVVTFNVG